MPANPLAYLQVIRCATCDASHPFPIKARVFPLDALFRFGRERGWDMDRKGKHKCPGCKEKEKMQADVRTNTGASEQPPRQMDAQDRRRVFRAVDEAYDDVNHRYVPGYTDETVAKNLGVPRKWVEIIREENFGPAGVDPQIAAIITEVNRLDAEIKKASAAYFEFLAAAEKRVSDLRARIERLA